jgi:hypothetical protein
MDAFSKTGIVVFGQVDSGGSSCSVSGAAVVFDSINLGPVLMNFDSTVL